MKLVVVIDTVYTYVTHTHHGQNSETNFMMIQTKINIKKINEKEKKNHQTPNHFFFYLFI